MNKYCLVLLSALLLSACGDDSTYASANKPPLFDKEEMAIDVSFSVEGNIDVAPEASENNNVTYSISTPPKYGTASIDENTGTITYTPFTDAHLYGEDSIVVQASDGVTTASLTVKLRLVNLPPLLVVDTFDHQLSHNAVHQINLNPVDPEGEAVEVTLHTPPSHGHAEIHDNQILVFKPSELGDLVVTLNLFDGENNRKQDIHIDVINSAPEFNLATSNYQTHYKNPIKITLKAHDKDNDLIHFKIKKSPAQGSAELIDNNVLLFTPSDEVLGNQIITISAQDEYAATDIDLTINSYNTSPEFTTNTTNFTTHVHQALSFKLSAIDTDNDPLTFAIAQQAVNGNAKIQNNQSVLFIPNANLTTGLLKVAVSDGRETRTLDILITTFNNPPAFDMDTIDFRTHYTKPLAIRLHANDLNNDEIRFSIKNHPENGVATINENVLTFTPSKVLGKHPIEVIASDGVSQSQITLSITTFNSAPIISADNIAKTASYKETVTFPFSVSDKDQQNVTVTITEQPNAGTGSIINGSLVYKPTGEVTGEQSIVLTATDGLAKTHQTFSVTLVNRPPEFNHTITDFEIQGSSPLSIALNATDPDNDKLSFSIKKQAENYGEAKIAQGNMLVFIPSASGTGQVIVTASDGTHSVDVTFTFTTKNHAPSISANETIKHSPYKDPVYFPFSVTDPDNEDVTITITEAPALGETKIVDNTLVYLPSGEPRTEHFVITASDQFTETSERFTVNLTNSQPAFTTSGNNFNTHVSEPITILLEASDPDNDPLTFYVESQPTNGTLEIVDTNKLVFTPNNVLDIDGISVYVTDGYDKNYIIFTFNVFNEAPEISTTEPSKTAYYKETIKFPFTALDPENKALDLLITKAPSSGETKIVDNTLIYIPSGELAGKQVFTLTASDGYAQTTQAFSVNLVNPPPTTPEATLNYKTIPDDAGAIVTDTVKAHDIDDDPLSFSIDSQPEHGSVTIDKDSGKFTYQSDNAYLGKDVFTVNISDEHSTISVRINIDIISFYFDVPEKEYISTNREVNDRFRLHGTDTAEFRIVSDKPDEIESLSVKNNGQFTLIAKPYAEPLLLTITATLGDSTDTKEMRIKTQQIDALADNADPLYTEQWHLKNTGQTGYADMHGSPGFDINIGELHNQGIRGQQVEVAIVDSGLEIAHEDLIDNVIENGSYDFVNNDNDPSPEPDDTDGDHGTSVAGLVGAVAGNQLGGRGVAPASQLTGFNFLANQEFYVWLATHGHDKTANARVINQSYGIVTPYFYALDAYNFGPQEAWLENHYQSKPDAALLIKAAGNGFNSLSKGYYAYQRVNTSLQESRLSHQNTNANPEGASFYNTMVAALSADHHAPKASYSTTGSSILFSAPGGEDGFDKPAMITTDVQGCVSGYSKEYYSDILETNAFLGGLTDALQAETNCNYTSHFNGTSSAAPVASGVASLVFSANPQLTWRDVRYVMAKTADKVHPNFPPVILTQDGEQYTAEQGWVTNAAGLSFSNWYGFGAINASKAVQMATRNYIPLPRLQYTPFINPKETGLTEIPENFTGITKTFEVKENWNVEGVQVRLDIDHSRLNDIAIEVISPSNTKSILLNPRSVHVLRMEEESYFLFLSHAFLDEKAHGTWKVRIIDTNKYNFTYTAQFVLEQPPTVLPNNEKLGKTRSVELRIYGHENVK